MNLTHEQMVEKYNNDENIIGFIGCGVFPISKLEENVSFLENIKYKDYFLYTIYDDIVIINFGYPHTYVDGRAINCGSKFDDSFIEFAKEFGVDNILTKSEWVAKVIELSPIDEDIDGIY